MPQLDRHRPRIIPIEFEKRQHLDDLSLEDRITFVLLDGGRADFTVNGISLEACAPCALCLSRYDRVRLLDENRIEARSFSFCPTFLNSSLSFENLKKSVLLEIEDQHDASLLAMFLHREENYQGLLDLPPSVYLKISEWMAVIGGETETQSVGFWTCRIRKHLLQMLYLIEDLFENRKTVLPVKAKSPVDLALEYIHIHYPAEISLQVLGEAAHINRTTLNRKFREQTGKTAMEYLSYYRIRVACDALIHTNLSLGEIAEASGFRYATYFIRQFSQKMGVTPTEYRQNFRAVRDDRYKKNNNASKRNGFCAL